MPYIVDDEHPHLEAEEFFINKVLHYSRMFESNPVSIHEILDLPYYLFEELIVQQSKLKEKERKYLEEQRQKNKRGQK
jgi:hypothetical protein